MPRQHERQSQDIRTDAIAMAIKKMGEGCEGCAYGYFKSGAQARCYRGGD